jgi:hypothetical protein
MDCELLERKRTRIGIYRLLLNHNYLMDVMKSVVHMNI